MKLMTVLFSTLVSLNVFAQATTTSVSAVAAGTEAPASTGTFSSGSSSGENTAKLKEVLKNKKFEEDHQITDAKLRADEGSFSKYSMKFNLSYYGPTAGDLGAADQPNPDNSNAPKETAIGGSLSARYRMDSRHAISVGSGLKAVHPFHGMERVDLNTPYLSYDTSSRIWGIQMRNSPGFSIVTVPNYTRTGEYASLDYSLSAVYDLGISGFALTTDLSGGYYLYNRDYKPGSTRSGGDGNAAVGTISFSPAVKYNFTDKFSMNTSVGLSWWNPRAQQGAYHMVLINSSVTQRIGMGYAFTRDIYFAPYLSLYPSKLAMDTTTVNLSTIFSVL